MKLAGLSLCSAAESWGGFMSHSLAGYGMCVFQLNFYSTLMDTNKYSEEILTQSLLNVYIGMRKSSSFSLHRM